MPARGEVICYHKYPLRGSKTKSQFMVSINDIRNSISQQCLFLFVTTDKPKRYKEASPGCNPDLQVFYLPSSNKECLKKNSYIELWIKPIPQMTLLNVGLVGRGIQSIGRLSQQCYDDLIACLKTTRINDIPHVFRNEVFNY
ncbi:MAG: hypothetical protein P9X24_14700 [Candidatus Hatepunaea meridiana]|nr:hypothetical protein [Candidatus Hatepunaea meridiana]